jgi:hypothetical protein
VRGTLISLALILPVYQSAMLPGNDFLSTIAYVQRGSSHPHRADATRRYQGIAAAQAYRAYGNNSLLDLAETVWADVAAYQISSAQAASGRHPLRKVSFQGTCNVGAAGTVPVAGAVFSVRRAPRPGVLAAHRVHA